MKKIIVVAVASLLLFSCNKKVEKDVLKADEVTHQDSLEITTLHLDNGEKWLVNNEMKPFVQQGENLVNSAIKNNDKDFAKLAKDIEDQNNQLIKSCTMDGASHDELHKWLHPHIELTKKLSKAENDDEAQITVAALQKSYQDYHNFFN